MLLVDNDFFKIECQSIHIYLGTEDVLYDKRSNVILMKVLQNKSYITMWRHVGGEKERVEGMGAKM